MSPDQYREKWRRESKRAIAEAIVAGEPAETAVPRIHRRWHRTVPIADLASQWRKAEGFAKLRKKIEAMREAMRPVSLAEQHARLSRMADPAAFVGPNGEVPALDAGPMVYWRGPHVNDRPVIVCKPSYYEKYQATQGTAGL